MEVPLESLEGGFAVVPAAAFLGALLFELLCFSVAGLIVQ